MLNLDLTLTRPSDWTQSARSSWLGKLRTGGSRAIQRLSAVRIVRGEENPSSILETVQREILSKRYCLQLLYTFQGVLENQCLLSLKMKINISNFGCILGKLEIALRWLWVIFYFHAFNCSCHNPVSFCWKPRAFQVPCPTDLHCQLKRVQPGRIVVNFHSKEWC